MALVEIRLVEELKTEVETLGMKVDISKSNEFEISVIGRLAMIDQNSKRVEIVLTPYEAWFLLYYFFEERLQKWSRRII